MECLCCAAKVYGLILMQKQTFPLLSPVKKRVVSLSKNVALRFFFAGRKNYRKLLFLWCGRFGAKALQNGNICFLQSHTSRKPYGFLFSRLITFFQRPQTLNNLEAVFWLRRLWSKKFSGHGFPLHNFNAFFANNFLLPHPLSAWTASKMRFQNP